jgi:imidazolonepropionase-like amidohydrolase
MTKTHPASARPLALILACLVATATVGPVAADIPQTTVMTRATLIDGTGRGPMENATIVIEGNRITSVTQGPWEGASDAETRVLDLRGAYVLPGLWNNHSHLGDLLPDPKNMLEDEPLLRASIRAGRNAMDALKAGFTSLRITGERDYLDVAWKEAFDSGVFVGPRIVPAGNPISHAGDSDWLVTGVDGPEAARALVRQHVEKGVEIIKLKAGRMSREEMAAVIDQAHELGVPVTAHSGGTVAHTLVELGVDSIEHGNDIADETIALMAEKGVFLDPTIVCNLSADFITERERLIREAGYEVPASVSEGRVLVSYADERSQERAELAREVLRKAYAAGVKITTGSDSNPIDELGILEIEQLVFSGLPEMGAILAATRKGQARRSDRAREESARAHLPPTLGDDGDQGRQDRQSIARRGRDQLLEALLPRVAACWPDVPQRQEGAEPSPRSPILLLATSTRLSTNWSPSRAVIKIRVPSGDHSGKASPKRIPSLS